MSGITRRQFIELTGAVGAGIVLTGFTGKVLFSFDRNFDIIIRNGKILDGTGREAYQADIGIKDGYIRAIGKLQEEEGIKVIDASGLYVTPGFVDIHSHTDSDLLLNPKAESKIRQGVTTEITGQDGFSWGPCGGPEQHLRERSFYTEFNEEFKWFEIKDFLDDLEQRRFAVNLATMVGLGTVREYVIGLDNRKATTDEIARMQDEVMKAIAQGAIGVSSGLEYTPGSFADTDELVKVLSAAPRKYRLYSTHMRNEDNYVLDAIKEAIEIAKRAEARLLIAHLKVSGKSNWEKADEALALIDNAANDIEVHADRYTYVAYHTDLSSLFPLWSRDGGTEAFLNRLKDKSLSASIKEYAEKKVSNLDGGWNGVLVSSIGKKELKQYQGKTILQLSEELGMEPYDACVFIVIGSENSAMMMGFGMEEKSTEKIIAHPRVMISSDAGSHAPYPPMNKNIAHPRAYGTFPRAIARYVRERKVCTLPEMIKKMTLMPAEKAGLKDRGKLTEGYAADIVIFDYNRIQDRATFTESHQYPDGLPYVIVNGKVVIDLGEHTGELPGKILRS